MLMKVCRFTRLTNAFRKRLAIRVHILSLYFLHYHFVGTHKMLLMSLTIAAGPNRGKRDGG